VRLVAPAVRRTVVKLKVRSRRQRAVRFHQLLGHCRSQRDDLLYDRKSYASEPIDPWALHHQFAHLAARS